MEKNNKDSNDEIVILLTQEIEKLNTICQHYERLYKKIHLLCCSPEHRGLRKDIKVMQKDLKALNHLRDSHLK